MNWVYMGRGEHALYKNNQERFNRRMLARVVPLPSTSLSSISTFTGYNYSVYGNNRTEGFAATIQEAKYMCNALLALEGLL